MSSITEVAQEANYYARIGWQVVPLHSIDDDGKCSCGGKCRPNSRGKHPRLTAWQRKATSDPDTVTEWFDQWPEANVGVRLGPTSELIDIEYDDEEGEATAAELLSDTKTPTFKSHRSVHHLFAFPDDIEIPKAVVKWRGLEIRFGTDAKGAQSVFPPSRHASGCVYEWIRDPRSTGVADAPAWLAEAIQADTGTVSDNGSGALEFVMRNTTETLDTHPGSPDGSRHAKACELIGRYIGLNGVTPELAPLALAWAGRCTPPWEEAKVLEIVSNFANREYSKQWEGGDGSTTTVAGDLVAKSLSVRRYTDIEIESVTWLWDHRIPLGKYTIFSGEPGVGKTFAALDVAAKVSTGGTYCDGAVAPRGDVLIISSEDGAGDTLKPRLLAAGADMSRILHLDAVDTVAGDDFLNLSQHVPQVRQFCQDLPELRLIIMDPLTAFLGDIDSHKEGAVRRVLGPVCELLQEYGVALLGIGHLNKSKAKAINRVVGSIGFVAAARVAWLFGYDPDDQSDQTVLMLPIKNNLSPSKTGLAYSIVDGVCVWSDRQVFASADDIDDDDAGVQSSRDEAREWLLAKLADGACPAKALLRDASGDGIAERTLHRAKKDLRVKSAKVGEAWMWVLPDDETPTAKQGEFIVE